MNLETTSYVFGIPHGKVRVKADGKVWLITCNSTRTVIPEAFALLVPMPRVQTPEIANKSPISVTGSDIVFLYKWCRANAPGVGNNQRKFRFENGKYAGEGEVKSVYKNLGFAALAVGIFGAIVSS